MPGRQSTIGSVQSTVPSAPTDRVDRFRPMGRRSRVRAVASYEHRLITALGHTISLGTGLSVRTPDLNKASNVPKLLKFGALPDRLPRSRARHRFHVSSLVFSRTIPV